MKIAYLAHLNVGPESGVLKKVLDQHAAWIRNGEEGRLYVLTRLNGIKEALPTDSFCGVYREDSWRDRLTQMQDLVAEIIKDQPDIVYMRQDHYYAAHGRLGRARPLVIEINSLVGQELWRYSKVQWLYNWVTEDSLWRASSGAVLVTNELAREKRRHIGRLPIKVIANGASLGGRTTLNAPPKDSPPTLFFIGSPGMKWHGIDKIFQLAKEFPNWIFHLVGQDVSSCPYDLPNVYPHGLMVESEYLPYLAASDVAVSTLALHRKSMDEACPLKTREYLAYGLPVIIGYQDTDFPEETDFLLRLENREDNIGMNIARIRDFVLRWKGKRVPRERVRRIDINEKERERVEFFRCVLGNR
ncbi:MAG: hypothetical protein ABFD52_06115 [Acidobacteriota bacterium]